MRIETDRTTSNPALKVLAIVPASFCYGLQHITLDFFGAMTTDIDAHFLVTHWNDGEFVRELEKKKIAYSYSWMGMFSRKLDWYNLKMSLHSLVKLPRLYYDVFKLYRKMKPDVLYFANHHELILLYPALLFIKKPVICHMHDPSPAIPFQQKTFRWYGNRVRHFIAISHDVKNRTVQLGADPDKVTVIHNGIKLNAQKSTERSNRFIEQFGWPQDVYIVGLTGQMTATKGHEEVIRALATLATAHPQLRIVIGGKKIEPYYTELVALIKELRLTDKVVFSGWLEQVGDFFEGIDLFVLASRHDEGYGLVVAEAMACNKPVVVTASGGVVEIVEDGVTGFIVPKMDITAMAERIARLSADPVLQRSMAVAGRKRIETEFDFDKKTKELKDLLYMFKNTSS